MQVECSLEKQWVGTSMCHRQSFLQSLLCTPYWVGFIRKTIFLTRLDDL